MTDEEFSEYRCLCGLPMAEIYDSHQAMVEDVGSNPDDWACPSCWQETDRGGAAAEAKEYALEHCRLTGVPEVYDPTLHYAPTPEEYESGAREAYTENSVRAHNRHNRTNYDELIAGLDRDDGTDQAYYHAIRERIEELLDECSEPADREVQS